MDCQGFVKFPMKKATFEAIVLHSAPKRTTLGLITYESMGLYFTGKKSDLTGLCEILNNFDLRFQKNSQKSKIFQ